MRWALVEIEMGNKKRKEEMERVVENRDKYRGIGIGMPMGGPVDRNTYAHGRMLRDRQKYYRINKLRIVDSNIMSSPNNNRIELT